LSVVLDLLIAIKKLYSPVENPAIHGLECTSVLYLFTLSSLITGIVSGKAFFLIGQINLNS